MRLIAMNNSWTGGQYSIFRSLFGIYLLIHFIHLTPWAIELFSSSGMIPNSSDSPLISLFPNILAIYDHPVFIICLTITASIASICLMIGYKDKIAALYLWYILACFFGRNPLIANPSLPYTGWMLLAHVFITAAPYGSILARNRLNPSGDWKMSKMIFASAWLVLAISYSYSGYTKLLSPSWVSGDNINYVLNNPLARDYFLRDFLLYLPPIFLKSLTWVVLYVELFFAPLALIPKLRPYLWLTMFMIQLGFVFLLNFPDLTASMILFHILTFDPAWIKPKKLTGLAVLYYDGQCGLCHKVIRFLLAEDQNGIFKFSPLQGDRFQKIIPKSQRDNLPDTIVLLTSDRQMLTHSSAVIFLLTHLGGLWRVIGLMLWVVPKSVRNYGYNFIGKIRYNFFKRPENNCPIISKHLRNRFI